MRPGVRNGPRAAGPGSATDDFDVDRGFRLQPAPRRWRAFERPAISSRSPPQSPQDRSTREPCERPRRRLRPPPAGREVLSPRSRTAPVGQIRGSGSPVPRSGSPSGIVPSNTRLTPGARGLYQCTAGPGELRSMARSEDARLAGWSGLLRVNTYPAHPGLPDSRPSHLRCPF